MSAKFEVRAHACKSLGCGVFATVDVEAFECVMTDRAVAVVEAGDANFADLVRGLAAAKGGFAGAVAWMRAQRFTRPSSAIGNPRHMDEQTRALAAQFGVGEWTALHQLLCVRNYSDEVSGFVTQHDRKTVLYDGASPVINHACVPNCVALRDLDCVRVYTTKPVRAAEELTVDYVPAFARVRPTTRARLLGAGFLPDSDRCLCATCAAERTAKARSERPVAPTATAANGAAAPFAFAPDPSAGKLAAKSTYQPIAWELAAVSSLPQGSLVLPDDADIGEKENWPLVRLNQACARIEVGWRALHLHDPRVAATLADGKAATDVAAGEPGAQMLKLVNSGVWSALGWARVVGERAAHVVLLATATAFALREADALELPYGSADNVPADIVNLYARLDNPRIVDFCRQVVALEGRRPQHASSAATAGNAGGGGGVASAGGAAGVGGVRVAGGAASAGGAAGVGGAASAGGAAGVGGAAVAAGPSAFSKAVALQAPDAVATLSAAMSERAAMMDKQLGKTGYADMVEEACIPRGTPWVIAVKFDTPEQLASGAAPSAALPFTRSQMVRAGFFQNVLPEFDALDHARQHLLVLAVRVPSIHPVTGRLGMRTATSFIRRNH